MMSKQIILFLFILVILSSTTVAIYQEPKIFDAPPSRNIIIKTLTTSDGVTRQFSTGELIINVPRKAWSADGTDETPNENRKAEPYERRQTFQSNLEFGTQAHSASYTSQASMNRNSIFKRTTPAIFIDRNRENKQINQNYQRTPTGKAILPEQNVLYAEQQEQSSLKPDLWIRTGATVTGIPEITQSPKGSNPYFFGGASQMRTAGQAYYQGDKPLYTTKGNPYALGGDSQQITAGQAGDIEEILKSRQERAKRLLAQMNTG